jgi:hypothetical protein
MSGQIKINYENPKFRFHITAIEVNENSIVLSGNNYKSSISVSFAEGDFDREKMSENIINLFIKICDEIHHRVVIPMKNELLSINHIENQVDVRIVNSNRRYSFPFNDVALFPIKNAHIQDLCFLLGETVAKEIKETVINHTFIHKCKIRVSQNIGSKEATFKFSLNN